MGKNQRKSSEPAAPLNDLWVYVGLFLATFIVYFQVAEFDFVDYDDPQYIENPHVCLGFTQEGLRWAFTSSEAANWFPVTRLSHMLDCQLFGLRSGAHHLTNVMLHALAVVLLFAFLRSATGALWRSAFVAFLFALHPLHVESVAWVAERKDVLSALFWFLTLWTYSRYAKRPGSGRYLLVFLPFCLGLMAKPMIVTLPFVLLLLDFWPLGRKRTATILWEKIPFLALSAGVAAIVYFAQESGGAVELLSVRPMGVRVENALVSYAVYIATMFWPTGLAVLYPYPVSISLWKAVVAGLMLIGISAFALRSYRDRPYLTTGWLWFLGTLVPVIGLVQVGIQSHADRYMYIPLTGLAIMLAWGAADIITRWPPAKSATIFAALMACSIAVAATWTQLQYWKNSETLYRRAIEVTRDNYAMHFNLGVVLSKIPGRLREAIPEYRETLRIKPDYAVAHMNLAVALAEIPGRAVEAIPEDEAALRIAPNLAEAHYNLGVALSRTPGRSAEAIPAYESALRIKPDYADAHMNLGLALAQIPGRLLDAIAEDEAVVRIRPDSAEGHFNLATMLARIPERMPEAISHYRTAVLLQPDYADAHTNLGVALSQVPGHLPEAISEYQIALRLKPEYVGVRVNLGVALSKVPGRVPEAISELEAALRVQPDPAVRQLVDRLRSSQGVSQ